MKETEQLNNLVKNLLSSRLQKSKKIIKENSQKEVRDINKEKESLNEKENVSFILLTHFNLIIDQQVK